MADRETFKGHALNAIDGKGRVAIPASMRATIEANSGQDRLLVISKHAKDPCLVGYDRNWLKLHHARLERQEEARVAAGGDIDFNVKRRAFGLVEEVPFDSSGRFILPAFFARKAQFNGLAFFFGWADYFEIWNPHVLMATPGIDPEMKEVAEFLLETRGDK